MIRPALTLLVVGAVLAGCGGQSEPKLARADAAPLIALADRVATLEATDKCGARQAAAQLQARALRLVHAGRVPVELQAELVSAVGGLELAASCPIPVSAPPSSRSPSPSVRAEDDEHSGHHSERRHERGKHHGHAKAKGRHGR
jgi:hypothetical protein